MSEFRWALHDAGGRELRATDRFRDRHEAETWMEREWRSLLEEGAQAASLLEDGTVLYCMDLNATA